MLIWPCTAPVLTDGGITLRPWRADDADSVLAACQDAEIQRWMDVPVPFLAEHAVAFVDNAQQQWASRQGTPFAIDDVPGERATGSCGLVAVRAGDLAAEVVCAVAPWARRRKVASRAARLLCGWAIAELGLARLEVHIEPANVASKAIAVKLGCRFEGLHRETSGARKETELYVLNA